MPLLSRAGSAKPSGLPRRLLRLSVVLYGCAILISVSLFLGLQSPSAQADDTEVHRTVAKRRLPALNIIAGGFWGNKANSQAAFASDKQIVYASDARQNTTLPSPYDAYRWTFLHANVVEENGKQQLEMLAFVDETSPSRKIGWWQLTLPNLWHIAHTAECRFGNGQETVPASLEWTFKRAPFDETKARWALLVTCPVARSLEGDTNVSFDLHFVDDKTVFTQQVALKQYQVTPPAAGSVAICLAPLYGAVNDAQMLEWRLHHAQLGVQAVHWYDRTGHPSTKHWVQQLNREKGLKDTWTEAPCISPESCGTNILEAQGLSGDQVLYYIDCLARSRHTHPTEWLAMIDVDEFLVPHTSNSSLSEFLASQKNTTAMLSFDRFQAPRAPVEPEQSRIALETVKTVKTPQEIDRHDNGKVLYRSTALKVPWIHWEVAFRENQPAQNKVIYRELDAPFKLVHVSSSAGAGPFNTSLDLGRILAQHVSAVKLQYAAFTKSLTAT